MNLSRVVRPSLSVVSRVSNVPPGSLKVSIFFWKSFEPVVVSTQRRPSGRRRPPLSSHSPWVSTPSLVVSSRASSSPVRASKYSVRAGTSLPFHHLPPPIHHRDVAAPLASTSHRYQIQFERGKVGRQGARSLPYGDPYTISR